jgi:hypothetical protein
MSAQRGIRFPGTFIVDRSGRVKARFFEDSYTVRDTCRASACGSMKEGHPSPPLRVQVGAVGRGRRIPPTLESVARGNRFSIVAQVMPHNGVHGVYAPGRRQLQGRST